MVPFPKSARRARRLKQRCALALAPALLLALAPAAHADDEAAFAGVVARSVALEGMSHKVGVALARSLEERGVRALLERGSDAAIDRGRLEDLRRLLADARGRHLEGDFQGAVRQADEAGRRFEEGFAFEADEDAWSVWTELMLVRALALSRLGQTRESDRTIASIAAARPSYVPDPGLAPPRFASRYALIRDKLDETRVSLSVTSRPAGAVVLVDGRRAGVTPLALDDLLPGRHFVSVRLGGARHDEALLIREGSQEVSAVLGDPRQRAAERLRLELSRGGSEAAVLSAARKVSPDTFVAVVEPGADAVPLLLGRVKEGRLVSVIAARVSDDLSDLDAVADALVERSLSASEDAWLAGGDASSLRPRFLGGRASVEGDDDAMPLVLAGVGVGALVLVGAGVVTGLVIFLNQPPNPGGIDVVVDASRL